MSSTPKNDYVFGLDLFRSVAILFVLVGHTFDHSFLPPWLAHVGRMGGLGVELFFVLSGFLIGSIIIRQIDLGRFHTFSDVFDFWRRRWLRTLPLYLVITVVFLRFDYHGRHSLFEYPLYFVFMQNFAWNIPDFFELSWSLAVEEHFYLWFPLVFLLCAQVVRGRLARLLLTASIFILIAYLYRLSFPLVTEWNEYTHSLRLRVLPRLDAVMFGVLMAGLKRYHRSAFDAIRKVTTWPAIAFLGICLWYYLGVQGILGSRLLQVNLGTVQSLVCCLLLPWFDAIKEKPKGAPGDLVVLTSRLSYSLYLVHILVIVGVNGVLHRLGVFDLVYAQALVVYPIYFMLYYLTAWITYSMVEKPFLQLREQPFSWGLWAVKSWPAVGTVAFLGLVG